jgi:hypothetical protein
MGRSHLIEEGRFEVDFKGKGFEKRGFVLSETITC